ncbi:MAG: hypothetical protein M1825_003777 [Sarcosagium campestre]|nr:MAG: hypothetical protein M1825_003777 [Sarcosagium campestre]
MYLPFRIPFFSSPPSDPSSSAPSSPIPSSSSSPPKSPPASSQPHPNNPQSQSRQQQQQRPHKQLPIFLAGATFFALSALTTRRSVYRRRLASIPAFYSPSNRGPTGADGSVSGALEAFEALTIATINVTSFSIMMVGGLLWAFRIDGMEDLRSRFRGALGDTSHADEELEEWIAMVLSRKEDKERGKVSAEETQEDESRSRKR